MNKKLSAILVIMAVVCYSAFAIGSGESTPTKETGSTSSQAASKAQDLTFKLNETAVFKEIKITATEIKISNGSEYIKPDSGKVYVGVKFKVENISSTEQTISSMLLFDAYVDNTKADLSISASTAFGGSTVDGTLAAGKSLEGYYGIEVKQGSKVAEFQVKGSWLSNQKAIFKLDIPSS